MNKTINLDLTTIDGNAFALIAAFRRQAMKENWTKEEIDEVVKEAKTVDYGYLVGTLAAHCKSGSDDGEKDEE